MTEAQQVRDQLIDAATIIGAARSIIADGKLVDLGELESRINELCSALPAVPAGDREEIKGALIEMIEALDKLAAEIKERHGELAEGLKGVSTHKRAVSAYGAGAATSRGPRK